MRKDNLKLRTEEDFQQRTRRADRGKTLHILAKAGRGNPPMKGDELPTDWPKQSKKPQHSKPRRAPAKAEGRRHAPQRP